MRRFWQFLTDSRTLGALGVLALVVIVLVGADLLGLAPLWALAALSLALLCGVAIWLVRHQQHKRAAQALSESMLADQAKPGSVEAQRELGVLHKNMLEAIDTIKTSKLGLLGGAAALYELPWYMIIGNPAAGKSSAIQRSGLRFPIPGTGAVHGVGGTRNCDWFFTTDGILLDTAGRYAVHDNERAEWYGFLALLKRHRPRAPINGILIAVSLSELSGASADRGIELAKSLRTRVQELTERLMVHAPVYVIFTKADLIAGFADFFQYCDRTERERVWGATLRFNRRGTQHDVLSFFDQHFDELCDGLREAGLVCMAHSRCDTLRSGVFTFPLAFADLKPPLRAFLSTLFEENTYQFKPVFRGFYFTSALQEGAAKRVAERFELAVGDDGEGNQGAQSGYFLLNLFRSIIFPDRDLVAQYTSRTAQRLRYGAFFGVALMLGLLLAGWSWSYMGNRQLLANVQADLDKVLRLQENRPGVQARLEALDILQDRIEQLANYRADAPLALSFGLYQGAALERKLRVEYFAGARDVMQKPVQDKLEALLAELNAKADQLQPAGPAGAAQAGAVSAKSAQQFQDVSATNVDDGYNALKTYLMLADKSRAEPGHLNDQLTRYWRGWLDSNRGSMPREQMKRSAERLLTFYLNQIDDPAWPVITPKLGLLDQARENLRRVVRGVPARERVYADIKARAATRFPAMTVARIVGEQDQALMQGSVAIPGSFTRDGWEKFINHAFKEAANGELKSVDWVLKTAARDDLTLDGSPEQIQKSLVDLYKADYTREWQKFVQGVAISELPSFDASVQAMNRLGDPQNSPLAKLLKTIYQETSWDNPGAPRADVGKLETGLLAWLKEVVLRRAPSEVRSGVEAGGAADPTRPRADPVMGPIGREFAGVARLVAPKDKDASLMGGYLEALSRLRSRLNVLKNQGDPGPGAKQFMQQTLEGSGSELADALKYVDEQMLTGMTDPQKQAIRPILVRPLMQTFAMIVGPSETEINKTWQAQVLTPFQANLAGKYPFAPNAKVEASNAEIGQLFGPDGALARFVTGALGPLVVRRGDVLAARTWADMGITLLPQVVSGFPGWIAPLGANGVASSASEPQTVFQIMPLPAPGTLEFTVEIDGQQLRYRNTPAVWTNMVHPSGQGAPGARISAITFDGRSVEVFNEAGQFGLKRMIDAATSTRKEGGVFELRWSRANVAVALDLKVTSSAAVTGGGEASAQSRGFHGLRLPEQIVGHGAPPAITTPPTITTPATTTPAKGATP